jgi:hypothetical protein
MKVKCAPYDESKRDQLVQAVGLVIGIGQTMAAEMSLNVEHKLYVEEAEGKWDVVVMVLVDKSSDEPFGFAITGCPTREIASELLAEIQAARETLGAENRSAMTEGMPLEDAQRTLDEMRKNDSQALEGIAFEAPEFRAMPLREFIAKVAQDYAKEAMVKAQQVPNTYLFMTGDRFGVSVQEFVGNTRQQVETRKNFVVEKMRRLFRQLSVDRYVQVSEIWMTEHASRAEFEAAPQPQDNPSREEYVMYNAEDAKEGILVLRQQILRNPDGTPYLGQLELNPFMTSEMAGRMIGLLPRTGKTS